MLNQQLAKFLWYVIDNKLSLAGGGAILSENKANAAPPAGAWTEVGLSLAINVFNL